MSMRNDVAFIFEDVISLYEQQSTYNPNMPVRMLSYLAKLYDKFIRKNKMNRYGKTLLHLPIPKLVVFYNGKEDQEDSILRLSDAFSTSTSGIEPDVDVRVKMININRGHNLELLSACEPLREYAEFVDRVRELGTEIDLANAVSRAMDEMADSSKLKQFLHEHREEVTGMCLTEYNEAETLQMIADENREEGRKEGRKEGRVEGREEGRVEGRKEGRKEGREEGRVEGRMETIDFIRKAKALIRSGKTTEEELVAEGIPEDVAAILLDVEPHKSRAKKSDRQIEISIEQRQEDIRRQTVERLVAYRKALGMTQQEIADALGVSRPNIGRFEKVDYNPTVDMIVKVADCMGLDVDIRFVKRKDR